MNTPSLGKFALGAAIAIAPVALSLAQDPGTSAAATAPAKDDDLFVLDAFKVSTDKDVGYLAGNTLAGSRLNTKLKDTGAAISVFTPEFIKDIGATNMKDLILFENNAVPDVGDAALSVNGNPMVGNDEWQLRIRGLAASYSRNYFKWDASSDFYNVDRIDQTRGPNSILFGFGSPGGLVNTSTKQAVLGASINEISYTFGSWNRNRGTLDSNLPLVSQTLALRVNAMAETGHTFREFEFDRARRADLTATWRVTKTATLRVEGEFGKITDNVARPWLAIDESFLWRDLGRPTAAHAQASNGWTPVAGTTYLWTSHRVAGDDGVVRDWSNYSLGSNNDNVNKSNSYWAIDPLGGVGGSASQYWATPTWSAISGNSIIPRNANTGGPDATRDTKYSALSAFSEGKAGDDVSYELALNHQSTDFTGYDPDGSRATTFYGNSTEIWGDSSSELPGSNAANPNAGKLFLENNWTRRTQNIKSTELRGTAAYTFATGNWAKHRLAGLLSYNDRKFDRLEEGEAFDTLAAGTTNAEDDINRLYRRHYFNEGDASDIHVQSWRVAIPGTRWVATQQPEHTEAKQSTGMLALQSFFFDSRLVTILGLRADSLKYSYNYPLVPTRSNGVIVLDPSKEASHNFDPNTLSAGAVYHLTNWLSLSANVSSSRDLPDLRIHTIDSTIPPMPESKGGDVGLKFDLLKGKLYATVGYYKGTTKHTTDWGTIQTDVTDRNKHILDALLAGSLITQADYNSHLINANGFMMDRDTSGWEMGLVANPTNNWRISTNFSINNLVARNSMAEVRSWADTNIAWWRAKVTAGGFDPATYPLTSGTSWDYLNANVGWMNTSIGSITALDGHEARGQRKYGANLYTKYTFDSGALKGFSIGGGGRYQSKNVLGMYDDTLDGIYNPTIHYGRSLTLLDASLGYSFPTAWIGKGSWTEIQFNVSNLLNKRDDQIYTLAWWGTLQSDGKTLVRAAERIGEQEPRKYTLSVSLHF